MAEVVLEKKEESSQIESTSLWTIQRLEQLNHYVQRRILEFIQGISALKELPPLMKAHKKELRVHLFYFVANLAVGILGALWGLRLLRPYLFQLLSSTKNRKSGGVLAQLSALSSFLMFPMVGALLITLVLNLILETLAFSWSRSRAFGCSLSGCPENAFTFLPPYIYFLFVVFLWTRIVFLSSRKHKPLIVLERSTAFIVSFLMRFAAVAFFCGVAWVSLATVLHMDPLGGRTFSDLMVLVSTIALVRGLSILYTELKRQPPEVGSKQILRWISFLKWSILFLCAIWLLARQWISQFMLPGAIFTIAFLIADPLQQILRRWRVTELWKHRRQKFLFKSILMSPRFMERITLWGIYLLFFLMLWIYLENFGGTETFSPLWRRLSAMLSSPMFGTFTNSFVMIMIAYILVKIGDRTLQYYVEEKYSAGTQANRVLASRLKTLMAMLRTFLRVIVWVPILIMISTQFVGAANLMTLGASLGAASFGLTFGFQPIVRDFVTGFFIILENNLMVGDEIEVDKHEGVVEEISLRTLKIRADNGSLLTIPFGSVSLISNKNRRFCAVVMNISASYNESVDRVQACVEKAFQVLKKTPGVGRQTLSPLEIRGLQEVTSYSIVFQIRIRTAPGAQDAVRRAFNRILKKLFDEEGITVPATTCSVALSQPSLTNTITSR